MPPANKPRTSNSGATFDSIVRYVMKRTRLTEDKARLLIVEVLKAGLAMGKIRRTAVGTYYLTTARPPHLINRIRNPRFSDNSDDTLSDLSD